MTSPGRPTLVLPLRAWLALSHLTVLFLPLVVLVGSGALGWDLRNQTREDLEHQAVLVAMLAEKEVAQARWLDEGASLTCCTESLSRELRRAKEGTLAGLRITDARGVVVATSGDVIGEDLAADAEVVAALAGRRGVAAKPRPAPSEMQPLGGPSRRARVRLFVAEPVVVDGEILGTVVLSRTPREELQALWQMAPRAALAAAGALVVTLALAWGAGVLATRSLMSLDRGALRIAAGSFDGIAELRRPQESHVAEVARVASSVSTMADRLRERLGYIGEFASNVSHEFKTPLATLRGTVELLTDDPEMPPPQRDRFLGNAGREIDRLERLMTGLLTLARAEEARAMSPVGLQALLQAVASDRGVALSGQADDVRGDGAQLDSVARNLVDNARRHGGEGVTVVFEAWRRGRSTGFDVIDDGAGISEANLPRVFDRFFTTNRQGGGTGLGLALVRAIVRRHGGEVTVESRPGRTVFSVSLPASSPPS